MSSSGRLPVVVALLLAACACFAQGAADLYANVSKSTVYLRHEIFMDPSLCRNAALVKHWEAETKVRYLSEYFTLWSGSGFLFDDDGLILTNRHVAAIADLSKARQDAATYLAGTVDERASAAFTVEERRKIKQDLYAMLTKGSYRLSATIRGKLVSDLSVPVMADRSGPDIALVKSPGGFGPGLRLAASDAVSPKIVGSEVYSFGFPLQNNFSDLVVTMNKGMISAIRKDTLNIQHSASISPGNSGGPLVDASGLVLGMNSATVKEGNSLFLAVGADVIRAFLADRGVSAMKGTPAPAAAASPGAQVAAESISVLAQLHQATGGSNAAEAVGVGALRVSSQVSVSGETGSTVFLDGQKVGSVPLMLVMTKGSASLAVRGLHGAYLARLQLDPTIRGATELPVVLEETGDLAISASESSAQVYFDGADLGKLGTGRFKALPAGAHRIELVGANAYCSQEVSIAAGSVSSVKAELKPVGRLDIKVPADFSTTVKGGTYSMTVSGGAGIPNVPVGDYSIKTSSGDGPAFTTSFSLTKGTQATWDPCTFGFVSLSVSPQGAVCALNSGRSFSADESSEAMAPGTYSAMLKHPGYRDAEISFTVFAGKRTRVSASLVELGRGAISLPHLGAPVILKVNGEIINGVNKPDGSVLYAGIPSEIPLAVLFSSGVAESTSLPDAKLSLSEGETRALELPTGRFSLPWLPQGAKVEIGTIQQVELTSAGGEGFLSPPLPPGEYRILITGGPKGSDYSTTVKITAAATFEPADYLGAMLSKLREERSSEAKSLSSYRARKARRIVGLTVGIAGGVASVACYILGNHAKGEYDKAELSADAVSDWEKVATYRRWNLISLAASTIGFVITPKMPSDQEGGDALRKSITALDESLRALGGMQR
jgi:S1-C subfamily serine protease